MALGPKDARVVARALRILERALRDDDSLKFDSSAPARSYLRCRIGSSEREEFVACYLTAQLRLVAAETLFVGTLTQTSVYPRELVKSALRHNAAAVIIAHNHPSGLCEPSEADLTLTRALREALNLVDVRLLDHIIVTASATTSLADKGLL